MSELSLVFYKVIKHHSHCLICNAPQIQMHHVAPREKISEVYKIAANGDMAATINEINKCVPLCDPHHRAVHKGNIPGWLDGKHDNGRSSDSFMVQQYRPYLVWFGKHHPHILKRFHRDYVEREHMALSGLFNQCGIALPRSFRLAVLDTGPGEIANDVPGNTGDREWPPRSTTRLSLVANNNGLDRA